MTCLIQLGEIHVKTPIFSGDVFNFPNKLNLPDGVKITEVACGRSHILMLSEKGQVFSIGEVMFVFMIQVVCYVHIFK
jgi:alpha-tubulin suppressor-like RCC1 family protein